MPYKPDILIYHDNCDDGFGAAWVVHQKWGDSVDYYASNYGLELPDFSAQDKDILIADFSLSLEQCEDLVNRGARIVMLDHHKTARDKLAGLHQLERPTLDDIEPRPAPLFGDWRDSVFVEFDMERSGARMVWDMIYPDEPVPLLIQTVEDRDLWRFALSTTRAISMYLRSVEHGFGHWSFVHRWLEKDAEQIVGHGASIQRYYDKQIDAICATANLEEFEGHEGVAVVVCCPYAFASDVCNKLLKLHPDAPFAMAMIATTKRVTHSLRSEDGRVDVSEIAKANGGGGHRNAAGFSTDIT